MDDIRDEIYCNCLVVKSIFGGGKHGCMGMMMADDLYLVEVGQAFVVPVLEGGYPNFPAGADEDGKSVRRQPSSNRRRPSKLLK